MFVCRGCDKVLVLYLSSWALFRGWHTVVVKCLTSSKVYNIAKNLLGKLYTITSEKIRKNAVGYSPMAEENVRYGRRRRFGRSYRVC